MKNRKILTVGVLMLVCAMLLMACVQRPSDTTATEQPAQEMAQAEPAEEPSEPAETQEPQAEDATAPQEEPAPDAAVSEEPLAGTGGETPAVEEAAQVTMTTLGEIQEVRDEEDQIHVLGDNEQDPANDIVANIIDGTIIIDAQTGRFVDDDTLRVGDKVQVTVSSAMTRSIPPIANAYMIVANVPDNMQGIPTYIIAEEVEIGDDGSARVLNQNKDTYVTIPAELKVDTVEDDGDAVAMNVEARDLKKGDVILAWYDVAAMSYPAQATAQQAMLIVAEIDD